MQRADEPAGGRTVSEEEGGPQSELTVAAPARDVSQQPGFKVVAEPPRTANNKLVWTAVIFVIAVLAGYVLGYLR